MTRVLRIDAGQLRKPTRTPQGFLRVDGIASRVGVFEYLNPDGSTRRELRLPEEVFRADALAGFEGASLTDGHPPEQVSADNVKQYEVGTVTGPARRDGESVIASMVVKDPKVIGKLERGDTGLSVGYAIDFEETPGTHPQYGRYDGIQRNLVINHLAVGVVPRAGNSARVRMDGASVQVERPPGAPMPDPTEKTDKQRADELEGEIKVKDKKIAELEALVAANAAAVESEATKAEKTRADAAEAKVARFDETFRAAVVARVKLEREAAAVMGAEFRMDGLDDRGIHAAVVKRLDISADVSSTTNDDMLRGQYRALVGKSVANAEAQARVSEILGRNTPSSRSDETEDEWEHYTKNSWKDTLKAGRTAAEGR